VTQLQLVNFIATYRLLAPGKYRDLYIAIRAVYLAKLIYALATFAERSDEKTATVFSCPIYLFGINF
jgi:hypothetical protein